MQNADQIQPTNVIFLGNEQLAQGLDHAICPSFEAMLQHGYQIVGLVLPEQKFRNPPRIIEIAKAHHIPIHFIKKTEEIIPLIHQSQASLGVLASFGKIIPRHVITAFPHGILNLHPSLLPKYRGTTPIETAILNGDSKTGISIMQLTSKMDAGPIFAQASVPIDENTTKQSLYETLATLGSKLLIDVLPQYLSHTASPTQQDNTKASFTRPLSKSDSLLDPSKNSAASLARQIKAYLNFPKSKLIIYGIPCTITLAHPASRASTAIDPICKDGQYLVIDQLIPINSKPMSAAAFLNGQKNRRTA